MLDNRQLSKYNTPVIFSERVRFMVIDITGLNKGMSVPIDLTTILENVQDASLSEKNVSLCITGKLSNINDNYIFEGKLCAKAVCVCFRCLEPVEILVEDDLFEKFSKTGQPFDSDKEEETWQFNDSMIDFKNLAETRFLLALPMKILCDENCKGLCSNCGTNLNFGICLCLETNTDPRFEVLNTLFPNNK